MSNKFYFRTSLLLEVTFLFKITELKQLKMKYI